MGDALSLLLYSEILTKTRVHRPGNASPSAPGHLFES